MQTVSPQPTLSIPPAAAAEADKADALYEASIPSVRETWARRANAAWALAGVCALVAFAWAEPWSARLLPRWTLPAAFALRGVLFVEAFGYAYHRFFQHLGWLTRRSLVFRRNQRFHWMHHMILYPIGRFYKRDVPYVSSEGGLGLSWLAPAVLAIAVAFGTMGLHVATFAFVGAMAAYAYFLVDDIHARFHLAKHSYQGNAYYKRLEDIHILHHWDQRDNFTIVHPLMDVIFGTYRSPDKNARELEVAYADRELTVSDVINWRYLLLEATPAEYAAFISEAKRHPRSLRKIGHLMEILHHRVVRHPEYSVAREMRARARDLLAVVAPAAA